MSELTFVVLPKSVRYFVLTPIEPLLNGNISITWHLEGICVHCLGVGRRVNADLPGFCRDDSLDAAAVLY